MTLCDEVAGAIDWASFCRLSSRRSQAEAFWSCLNGKHLGTADSADRCGEGRVNRKQHLYSIYRRIRTNCCEEWRRDPKSFYSWYQSQVREQGDVCVYCELPGNTEAYYQRTFRKGRRGVHLEVDRKDSSGRYSPDNCILACYPCNNAKSDVFSYREFEEIGQTIRRVKQV